MWDHVGRLTQGCQIKSKSNLISLSNRMFLAKSNRIRFDLTALADSVTVSFLFPFFFFFTFFQSHFSEIEQVFERETMWPFERWLRNS
jgi:hypothetical protein